MVEPEVPGNKPEILTDSSFRELVLEAEGIVVVDFWAPWCGPCIQMGPALDAFSEANEGRVKVYKLNADDNPKTAEKYEIRSIPTIIFFEEAKPLFVSRGAMSQSSLQKKLDELLAQSS
jgi:thioredoxin 1